MKRLAAGVAKGLSLTDAGKLAGYSNRQAASRAYKTIRLRFHPALEAAGYDVDKELTTIYAKLREKMECNETVFFQSGGIVMETRHVEAHAIQIRAAVEIAKMIGLYPSVTDAAYESEAENKVPGITLTIVVGTLEEAKELGAVFINPRTKPKQLTQGDDLNEDAQRRPGPEPEL